MTVALVDPFGPFLWPDKTAQTRSAWPPLPEHRFFAPHRSALVKAIPQFSGGMPEHADRVPLDLDGYLLSGEWQSGKARQVLSRKVADFKGWDGKHETFESQVEQLILALRADEGAKAPRARNQNFERRLPWDVRTPGTGAVSLFPLFDYFSNHAQMRLTPATQDIRSGFGKHLRD